MLKKSKKGMTVCILLCLVSMLMATFASAAPNEEVIPKWVSEEIAAWKSLNLLKGDQLGNINPQNEISTAEMATIIARIMNYQAEGKKSFSDVDDTAWYATAIKQAADANILQGDSNGLVHPLSAITREQAAVILVRLFQLTNVEQGNTTFNDDSSISGWAKSAVYALKQAGFVVGNQNGDFQPKKPITRAEMIKMINNVMGTLVNTSGTYSNITGHNLVVNTAGVTLSNIELTGNLYITVGTDDGELVLDNVKVTGKIIVNGGGKVTINNSTAGEIVVNNNVGTTNVELKGTTTAATVLINTATNLSIDPTSTIALLTVNAAADVKGKGTITRALINSDGASFENAPSDYTLNAASVTIDGKKIIKEAATDPSVVTDDTSAGIINKTTKLYTYESMLSIKKPSSAEKLAQQYITFLQDPTYTPSIANSATDVPDFTNAITFVNADFNIKPSIFPSLRAINTSVLSEDRNTLWVGTDSGVTKINLKNNKMTNYSVDNKQLADDKVLLLISDNSTGVIAITETGVSHIYQ